MYAVFKTGGKQYKASVGDVLKIEKIAGNKGETISFDTVLLVGENENVKVGAPVIANASVAAEVLEQKKDDKIIIFKKKRRQNYRRKNGHRQEVSVVRITNISAEGVSGKKTAKKATSPKAAEESAA